MIAHRPATIALADRVAVLEGGRIVEQGTHDELLRRSPRYRELLALEDRRMMERASTGEVWRATREPHAPVQQLYFGAAAAVIVSTLITLAGPALVGYAVDNGIVKHDLRPAERRRGGAARPRGAEAAGRARADAAGRDRQRALPDELRAAAFEKLQALPLGFFEQERTGVLVSRLTSDVQALDEFLREAWSRSSAAACRSR